MGECDEDLAAVLQKNTTIWGIGVQVEGCHQMPAAEVYHVLFDHLVEEIQIGRFIEQIDIGIRGQPGQNLVEHPLCIQSQDLTDSLACHHVSA